MADAKDPLNVLFSRVRDGRTLETLPPAMVDEIRALLHHKNGGANIVYDENPKAPPILSSVYYRGKELGTDNPSYDKEHLILSATPAQDSLRIATETHLGHYCVGSMCAPELNFFQPNYEMGSCAYLALDRKPNNGQSFLGIVQADPLWDVISQRKKLLSCMYDAVCLYSGDKKRSNTSHPHWGYQFFFGHHKSYRDTPIIYIPRPSGKGHDEVSTKILFIPMSYSNNIYISYYIT